MWKKTLKPAFIDTLPVMTGYLVLGMGFGIILKTNGYGFWWAFAMSFFIYAGSMQYVGVGLLSSGASLISVALTTLMVNARHLFYGLSMIEKYKDAGIKKPYLIFALTDETYSLVCSKGEDLPKKQRTWYYFFVSLFNQCYWISGSLIGSLIGSIIPFNTQGIEFALTALFITVFTEQWLKTKNHFAAISGIVASVICLVIFGSENFLIPDMILITIVLSVMKKFTGEEKADE
ncbi:MAG: AzlC family ABC transporter permease [Acutalibacteraceae bacterium]